CSDPGAQRIEKAGLQVGFDLLVQTDHGCAGQVRDLPDVDRFAVGSLEGTAALVDRSQQVVEDLQGLATVVGVLMLVFGVAVQTAVTGASSFVLTGAFDECATCIGQSRPERLRVCEPL